MVSLFIALSLETSPRMTSEMRVIWEMGMNRMLKASDDQKEEVGYLPSSSLQVLQHINFQRGSLIRGLDLKVGTQSIPIHQLP